MSTGHFWLIPLDPSDGRPPKVAKLEVMATQETADSQRHPFMILDVRCLDLNARLAIFYPLTLISTPKPVRALPVNRYDAAFASSG
ncbi:MAG: hypothetical protein CBC55_10115 [Gammaproteobacteria bacterium TMED95]|nr:hypothetical protein [Gammaproteobacteria bacterium]OUV20168.1 MAG: hypothetical protein CBC55_10115 [Gammaproteobacteria bacterium TMED95]